MQNWFVWNRIVYMYKYRFGINSIQWLMCHKTKLNPIYKWFTFIIIIMSCRFPQSVIASGKSSGLHPVSSHSGCMYVRAGRPALARPYAGVHRSTSLMSSSLLLEQCPSCLVRLTWIVFVMGERWPYSWCFVGYCRPDLFDIARNILL